MVFKMKIKETQQNIKCRRVLVACGCWFTSSGRTIPKTIKYEDEDGMIHTIQNIHVLNSEKRRTAGISAMVYDCLMEIEGQEYPLQLYHFQEEGKWELQLPE